MQGKNIISKLASTLLFFLLVIAMIMNSYSGLALDAQNIILSNQTPIYNNSNENPSDENIDETPAPLAHTNDDDSGLTDEFANSGQTGNTPPAATTSPQDVGETTPVISADPNAPSLYSKHLALVDADTGILLYEKAANIRTSPASTTKIMTGIIALEHIEDLSEMVTVGPSVNELGSDSSKMGIIAGETISLKDLVYGLLMVSGNDAAVVLAEHVAGSQEAFSAMMNQKAEELGLRDTHFVNPHGLTNEQHYSTAENMAQIMRYAMTNPDFAAIESKTHYDRIPTNKNASPPRMFNSNRFITSKENMQTFNWSACTGGKSGYTHDAQGCLVVSASYNGMNMIAVALHDDSAGQVKRWEDTKNLIEYGFNNLVKLDLGAIDFNNIKVYVDQYSKSDESEGALDVAVKADGIVISGMKYDLEPIINGSVNLDIAPNINQGINLSAPIEQGQKVGTAMILRGENRLAEVDLIATRSIASSADDSVNPISTLFASTGSNKGNGVTGFLAKLFIAFGAIVVLLIVILLVRKILAPKRQTKRRRNPAKKPPSRYNSRYD